MSVDQEILVTGIKVVDLLAPYVRGGKIGTALCCLFVCLLFVVCSDDIVRLESLNRVMYNPWLYLFTSLKLVLQ